MNYRVLWFDDEHETLELIRDDALANGIELIGYGNADDGLARLEKELELFDAVIVDGKFFDRREHTGDTVSDDAFVRVARAFDQLAGRKVIPWFILSGQVSFTREENPFAKAFKGDKVYDKNKDEDYTALWTDIKVNAAGQTDTQIRYKYRKVFEVCTEKYIGTNAAKALLFILSKERSDVEFINADVYFTPVRKIVEDLFRAMNKYGLLPDDFVSETVSLNESSRFLSGQPIKQYRVTSEQFPGRIIINNIRNILALCQPASHRGEVDEFLKKVKSPFLLFSCTYELMNVLLWFKQFVDENPSADKNKLLWQKLMEEIDNFIEGTILYDGRNYYVKDCIVLKNKFEGQFEEGDQVRITKFSRNRNERSKQYQFFADAIVKVD